MDKSTLSYGVVNAPDFITNVTSFQPSRIWASVESSYCLLAPSDPTWGHTCADRVGVLSPELSVAQKPWLRPFLVDGRDPRVYWDCPYFCWCKQAEFLGGKLPQGWAFLTRDKWVLSTWILTIKHKIAFGIQSGSCAWPGGFVHDFCEHWAGLYSFLQREQLSPFPVKHRLLLL